MRKRNRGETNLKGETKALILLYIANKGSTHTNDIREYLKNNKKGLRIKTKNLVYQHLKELEKNGFIKRIPQTNNKADAFKIQDGFENFKNIFQFMLNLELELALLKTPYYIQYVESDKFIIKLIINTFKESILRAYEDINQDIDDNEFEEYEKEYEKELQLLKEKMPLTINGDDLFTYGKKKAFEIRDSLRKGDQDDKHVIFYKMIHETLDKGVDVIYDDLIYLIGKSENRNKNILPEQALKSITGFLIPWHERNNISNILKYSPLAIEYILNIKEHSPIMFIGILWDYFLIAVSFDEKKIKLLNSDRPLTKAEYDYLINNSNIKGESPLVRLIKSAFIIDYFDERIVKNKFSEDLLNGLFSINNKIAYL